MKYHVITILPVMSMLARKTTKEVIAAYSSDHEWYPLPDGTGYWFYYQGESLPLLMKLNALYCSKIVNGFGILTYDE